MNIIRSSWTAYDLGGAFQLQPSLIIGLFDDIFYRQFNTNELHLDPAANFLTLAGVLWFCINSKRSDNRRFAFALGITCILALAMVFGVIPPALIIRVPFLRNIMHIDNTFSCVAIICLLILAGFGIKTFWNDCQASDFRRTYLRMVVLLSLLLALILVPLKPRSARILHCSLSAGIDRLPLLLGLFVLTRRRDGCIAFNWEKRDRSQPRSSVAHRFAIVPIHSSALAARDDSLRRPSTHT